MVVEAGSPGESATRRGGGCVLGCAVTAATNAPAAGAVRLTNKTKNNLKLLGMQKELIPQSKFPPPCPHKNLFVLGPTLHPTSGTGRNPNVQRAATVHHLNYYPSCGDTSKKRKAPPETPKEMLCFRAGTSSFLYFSL